MIDFHHVRASQVDGALDPECAAHRILSWFDDDHGAVQGRSKRERVSDVVERKPAATVPTRSRIVIDVNDYPLTPWRRIEALTLTPGRRRQDTYRQTEKRGLS
jgi:hypothetical protein